MKKDIWNSVAQYLIKRWVTFAVWLGERIPPPRVFDCFENIWPKKWILLFELRAHSTNISACITVYNCQAYIGILSQMGLKYFLLLLFFPTSFIFLLLIMCSSSSGGGGGDSSSVTVSFGYFFCDDDYYYVAVFCCCYYHQVRQPLYYPCFCPQVHLVA